MVKIPSLNLAPRLFHAKKCIECRLGEVTTEQKETAYVVNGWSRSNKKSGQFSLRLTAVVKQLYIISLQIKFQDFRRIPEGWETPNRKKNGEKGGGFSDSA